MYDSMQKMIQEAREKGLWLWASYHDLWFSPDELESQQAEGQFCWGPANWELRDPSNQVSYLKWRATNAEEELRIFQGRIALSKEGV